MLDVFVVLSGTFSIAATFPLLYLAVRSLRDARHLRRLQLEVAELMVQVHQLQGEIHHETLVATSRLEDLTRPRRRVPRVRLSVER